MPPTKRKADVSGPSIRKTHKSNPSTIYPGNDESELDGGLLLSQQFHGHSKASISNLADTRDYLRAYRKICEGVSQDLKSTLDDHQKIRDSMYKRTLDVFHKRDKATLLSNRSPAASSYDCKITYHTPLASIMVQRVLSEARAVQQIYNITEQAAKQGACLDALQQDTIKDLKSLQSVLDAGKDYTSRRVSAFTALESPPKPPNSPIDESEMSSRWTQLVPPANTATIPSEHWGAVAIKTKKAITKLNLHILG